MKYCTHCGKELFDDAVRCPMCGQFCPDAMQSDAQNDVKWNSYAIGGFITSFLFSIVGLVLSIIGYRQCKKNNEKGGAFALAGIIISSVIIAVYLIIVLFYMSFLVAVLSSLFRT